MIDSTNTRMLQQFAQLLDDIEGLRKAQGNRYRILTLNEPDSDGVMRGFGLTENNRSVALVKMLNEDLEDIEGDVIKELQRLMREHPLGSWVKAQKGVGEKQAARLLAEIGDPYYVPEAEFEDDDGNVIVRPARYRTVSELWAYAGLHVDRKNGAAVRRRKGVQSNWKTAIKTRAYLVATSCIKTDGKYREVYDKRRAHTAETHPEWTPGHSHADALRIVSKEILKDLWVESKRLHEEARAAQIAREETAQ